VVAVRLDPTDIQSAPAAGRRRSTRARIGRSLKIFRSALWAAVAVLIPLAAQAQSVQLGIINVPVNVPTLPTAPVTVNVPTNVLGNLVNVPLNVVAGTATNTLNVSSTTITVPINLLGNTINVSVTVPSTTITVTGGPVTINVPVGVNAPISINIPTGGLVGAVNALDAIGAVRRNDALLGLDLGLDRQIDILNGVNGHWADSGDPWSEPTGLGGPRLSSAMLDAWGGGSPRGSAFGAETFATSLQQARQASAATTNETFGAPYGLGATSRPPAPTRTAFDVWVEGAISRFSDGSDQSERHGQLGVIYIGADYRLSPSLLVGTLVQFNETSHSFDALPSGGSDRGWMIGPYATVRLSNNLFFQARAAWGKTDVKLDLDSTHQDSFDAERWLVRGTLLGQWRWGSWQFRPRASVGYIEERQESYASSLGATIPSQTVALGQAKAGPEIAYRYRLANGSIVEPSLLVEGIWNFLRDGGSLSIDDLAVGDKVRGRAEAGIALRTPGGTAFGAAVSYDGIGSSDYQAVGGKLRVQVPFN
jgi:autotransporter-like protein